MIDEGFFRCKFTEIYRTVVNGNLKVFNVPHLYNNGELFADGEDTILSGYAMYTLTKIFRYMLDNKITEIDFKEFESKE